MNRRLRWLPALLLPALLASSPVLRADLDPGRRAEAEALLRQFSAPEFDVRRQAVEKLVAMGSDVVPLVKKAREATADNEVRLRCDMTLKGIAEKFGVETADAPPRRFGLGPSRATLDVAEMPFQQALDLLANQTDSPAFEAGEFGDRRVTFRAKDATWWEAFDALSAQADLAWAVDYGKQQVRLIPADRVQDFGARAGPIAIKLTRAESHRNPPEPLRAEFHFDYACEPGARPLRVSVVFRRAFGADGKALRVSPDSIASLWCDANGFVVGTAGARIDGLSPDQPRVARLEGAVRVLGGSGRATFRFENVLDAEDAEVSVGKTTLTVTPLPRRRDFIVIGVRRTVDGADAPLPLTPRGGYYGVQLVDAGGARYPGGVFAGHEARDDDPETTPLRRAAAQVPPQSRGPYALIVTLPEKTEEAEFPFVLENLPTP